MGFWCMCRALSLHSPMRTVMLLAGIATTSADTRVRACSSYRGFFAVIEVNLAPCISCSKMPPRRTPNVHGRQRSCFECVKAKRKCDMRQPHCARCSRQSLPCTYPRQLELPPALSNIEGSEDLPDQFKAATTNPIIGTTTPLLDLEYLDALTTFEDQLLDFDMPTAVTSWNSLSHFMCSPTNDDDQTGLHNIDHTSRPSIISWANITPLVRSRIGYAIDQLKLAPRMMVETNSTLWSHVALYDEHMPRLLQDAHAACALYNARNDTNANFVDRHIIGRVDELLATSLPTASIEILAQARALMLYQIMLVFGGNIRFCSYIESLMPHLEEVGNLLLNLSTQQTDPTDPLPV